MEYILPDEHRELRRKRLVDAAMRKHGLKSASKRARALAAAEEEADETLEFLDSRATLGEQHVRGGDLAVHLKQRADKEARLAKVLEGASRSPSLQPCMLFNGNPVHACCILPPLQVN